jgi:cobalt-zinc-cadmium efflux system membrane fusion protein
MIMKNRFNPFLFVLVAAMLQSCGSSNNTATKQNTASQPTSFVITKEQAQKINIEAVNLNKDKISPVVYSTGKITLGSAGKAIISSKIEGKISRIFVNKGDVVRRGQAIFELSSIELIELQQNYIAAYNDLQYLKVEYERQKELVKEKVGALASFQSVENKYKLALNTEEALEEKLKLIGINTDVLIESQQIQSSIPLTSPIDGSVFEINASLGETIQTGEDLALVNSLGDLFLQVNVFEKDVEYIRMGQKVEIELPNKKASIQGFVKNIVKGIDTETRSIPVIVSFEAGEHVLLPDMILRVNFRSETQTIEAVIVPASALVEEGDFFYVFLAEQQADQWVISKQKVSKLQSDMANIAIQFQEEVDLSNKKVVSQNAYLVDAEAKKQKK